MLKLMHFVTWILQKHRIEFKKFLWLGILLPSWLVISRTFKKRTMAGFLTVSGIFEAISKTFPLKFVKFILSSLL